MMYTQASHHERGYSYSVSNANVLAARTVLAKSTCAIMSWLPLEAGSEPVSDALLTRSEFPERWIPLDAVDQWKPSNAVCV